jgi:hypothetical protein
MWNSYFPTQAVYEAKCTGDYRMTFENLVGTNLAGGLFTDLGEVGNFVTESGFTLTASPLELRTHMKTNSLTPRTLVPWKIKVKYRSHTGIIEVEREMTVTTDCNIKVW